MTKSVSRKKRNKLAIVLLAPILAITFITGWTLSWIGQTGQPKTKQPQKTINKTPAKQHEIELIMIPQEEQIPTK